MPDDRLSLALSYAARGWYVFPLAPNSKKPLKGSHGLHDATLDTSQITAWFKEHPEYNIGIRTGEVSNLVVLDVDKRKNGIFSLQEILSEMQYTMRVRTPGGLHLYYEYFKTGNREGIRPGLDIRGDGGYVTAPGSSIDSNRYKVDLDLELSPFPAAIVEILMEKPIAPESTGPGEIGPGQRNGYLTKIAGYMQRGGVLTLDGLDAVNQRDCDPPLPQAEISSIFGSVGRYPVEARVTPGLGVDRPFTEAYTLSEAMFKALSDKEKIKGKETSIQGLDQMLGGGLRKSELTALHATAKTGKNAVLHYIIQNLLNKGIPVGYASREMRPTDEVLPNLLSIEFGELAWEQEMNINRMNMYNTALKKWDLYFSQGYGYFNIDLMHEWIKSLMSKGVEYFFVDHLHYCLAEPEDYTKAVILTQTLKKWANEYDISMNIIIQPTKTYDDMRLGLNSLRGGAGIGQALDNLLILERYKVQGRAVPNISVLTLDVARSRLATPGSIYLEYNRRTTRFKEVVPKVEDQVQDPDLKKVM